PGCSDGTLATPRRSAHTPTPSPDSGTLSTVSAVCSSTPWATRVLPSCRPRLASQQHQRPATTRCLVTRAHQFRGHPLSSDQGLVATHGTRSLTRGPPVYRRRSYQSVADYVFSNHAIRR